MGWGGRGKEHYFSRSTLGAQNHKAKAIKKKEEKKKAAHEGTDISSLASWPGPRAFVR